MILLVSGKQKFRRPAVQKQTVLLLQRWVALFTFCGQATFFGRVQKTRALHPRVDKAKAGDETRLYSY
jgi:hypothetical protein